MARNHARTHIKIADHMLTQTFPLVKDTKLLLAAADNVFQAVKYSMDAILYYERLFKRIPPFSNTFVSKLNIFEARCTRRYDFPAEYLTLIKELYDIVEKHKNSPVEFSRDNKFVICTDTYRMKTITAEQLKKYIETTKGFVTQMEQMVSKHDELFK